VCRGFGFPGWAVGLGGAMVLPDYTSAINTQLNGFLSNPSVAGMVALVLGVGLGAYVVIQVFSVFRKSS
jgi:hypothetical protein